MILYLGSYVNILLIKLLASGDILPHSSSKKERVENGIFSLSSDLIQQDKSIKIVLIIIISIETYHRIWIFPNELFSRFPYHYDHQKEDSHITVYTLWLHMTTHRIFHHNFYLELLEQYNKPCLENCKIRYHVNFWF